MPPEDRAFLRVAHPVVQLVHPDIFRFSFAADCMTHACRVEENADDNGCGTAYHQDDACCRYGCDVDLFERDAIQKRAAEIARIMPPDLRDPARWFDDAQAEEADSPSGICTRTARVDMSKEAGRCVFLGHDQRGCALHRAALESGFAPEEIKPVVCRLYPLSFAEAALGLADDFEWYNCAHHQGGPSVYRVMRDTLLSVYGEDCVRALDDVEASVLRLHLRVTAA
jgi:Fe-S-cluster containining protein